MVGAWSVCVLFGLEVLSFVLFGGMLLILVILMMCLFIGDSSAALVLDLRRKLKAVLNLLDAIVRCGASLTRDVELSHLWDCIVSLGSMGSVSVEDYDAARTCGVGESRRLVAGMYDRVSAFIRAIVAHRRNVGITAWRSWLREDPLVHPERWLRADRLPSLPFHQC